MDNVTRLLMQGAAGAGGEGTYVDDVFSTYLYKGNGATQTISNGIKLSNNNAGNGVKFSGSSGQLEVASTSDFAFGTDPFTIEFWLYFHSVTDYCAMFEGRPNSGNGAYLTFGFASGYLSSYSDSAYRTQGSTGTTAPAVGQWTHIALVREGTGTNEEKIYFNGTQVAQGTNPVNIGNQRCMIAGHAWSRGNFNGHISNYRVTKGQALYTSNFTPSTQALTTTSQGAIASNVKLLCCNKNIVTGATVTPGTITVTSGNPVSQGFGPFTAGDGEGGMVWIKSRNWTRSHNIYDTVRGTNKVIYTESTTAEVTKGPANQDSGIYQFNNNGFSIGAINGVGANGYDYSSWTFRKAPGFFDVVTYTGNGSNRTIDHSLGSVPGMIFIKNRDDGSEWWAAYHRYLNVGADPEQYYLRLNDNNAQATSADLWNNTAPTSTNFSLGSGNAVNKNGDRFVAYVFAGGASTATGARSVEFETASSEFLNIPTSSSDMEMGTSDFTIEAWIFPQDQDTANWNCIFTCNTDFQLTWKERALKFYAPGIALTTGETYRVRQWHHVAVTRSGNTFRLFVNGELKDEGTSSSAIPGLSGYYPSIGAKNSSSDYFWGRISNLRLVKGTALYTSAFKPSTKPLTSVTNTKLLCCNGSTVTSATVTPATLNSSGTPVARPDSPFDDPTGFAFGDSNENIIKCGHYNGSGSNNSDVYIGWEPSWVLIKNSSNSANWTIFDNMRGVFAGSNDHMIRANLLSDENSNFNQIEFTPTGFRLQGAYVNAGGQKYVYIAIRRPDGLVGKPPEVGTDAFAMDTGAGTTTIPNFDGNFPVDFAIIATPGTAGQHRNTGARLTGPKYMRTNGNNAESGHAGFTFDWNAGWGSQGDGSNWQSWHWKRHAGFDVVTYKGDLVAGRQIPHSLNKIPEMLWVKRRNDASDWIVWHKGLNGGTNSGQYYVMLNSTNNESSASYYWNNTTQNSKTFFTLGGNASVNGENDTFMAMLFASVEGISKLGYYDGTGSVGHVITTGFTPRLLIIKNITNGNSWFLYDSLRGLGAGNDPYLQMENTNAQAGGDTFAISSTGFTINQTYSSVNQSGSKYIYYAHA